MNWNIWVFQAISLNRLGPSKHIMLFLLLACPSLNGMLFSPLAGSIIEWSAVLTSGWVHHWIERSHLWLGPSLNGMLFSPLVGSIIEWYVGSTSDWVHHWMVCSHLWLGPSLNGMLFSPLVGPIIEWYVVLTSGWVYHWMVCCSHLWLGPLLTGMLFSHLSRPSLNGILFPPLAGSIIKWYAVLTFSDWAHHWMLYHSHLVSQMK